MTDKEKDSIDQVDDIQEESSEVVEIDNSSDVGTPEVGPNPVIAAEAGEGEPEEEPADSGEEIIPLLPLKATVILPHTLVPLAAAQERSLKLIDAVMQGDRMVAMVMQKDDQQDNAGPDDILGIGTVATIHQMMRVPDGTMRLAV